MRSLQGRPRHASPFNPTAIGHTEPKSPRSSSKMWRRAFHLPRCRPQPACSDAGATFGPCGVSDFRLGLGSVALARFGLVHRPGSTNLFWTARASSTARARTRNSPNSTVLALQHICHLPMPFKVLRLAVRVEYRFLQACYRLPPQVRHEICVDPEFVQVSTLSSAAGSSASLDATRKTVALILPKVTRPSACPFVELEVGAPQG